MLLSKKRGREQRFFCPHKTPVLHKGIEYDKRLMSISVDYEETLSLLKQHFKPVTMFNESFIDEKETLVTFIAKK